MSTTDGSAQLINEQDPTTHRYRVRTADGEMQLKPIKSDMGTMSGRIETDSISAARDYAGISTTLVHTQHYCDGSVRHGQIVD